MRSFHRNFSESAALVVARFLLGCLCLAPSLPVVATTVFDNTVNNSHAQFQNSGIETGDEIQLAGTARYLTNFSFGYVLYVNDPTPHVTACVRFYLNDGVEPFETNPVPGTMFFDSGWLSVGPPAGSIYGTLDLSAGSGLPDDGLFLPSSDFTWSIQYQGLEGSEVGGVREFSPPVVGSDLPTFWSNFGGNWVEQGSSRGAIDFNALFEASDVPEPSVLATFFLGIVILLFCPRNRRTPVNPS
jgi:hypothetical protein